MWCPAVVVPPRLPLCGHLPRGQRRELLWTIGQDKLVFEARVEVRKDYIFSHLRPTRIEVTTPERDWSTARPIDWPLCFAAC